MSMKISTGVLMALLASILCGQHPVTSHKIDLMQDNSFDIKDVYKDINKYLMQQLPNNPIALDNIACAAERLDKDPIDAKNLTWRAWRQFVDLEQIYLADDCNGVDAMGWLLQENADAAGLELYSLTSESSSRVQLVIRDAEHYHAKKCSDNYPEGLVCRGSAEWMRYLNTCCLIATIIKEFAKTSEFPPSECFPRSTKASELGRKISNADLEAWTAAIKAAHEIEALPGGAFVKKVSSELSKVCSRILKQSEDKMVAANFYRSMNGGFSREWPREDWVYHLFCRSFEGKSLDEYASYIEPQLQRANPSIGWYNPLEYDCHRHS